MRKLIPAAVAAAVLAAGALPATAAAIPGPPLDPVTYDPGHSCPPPEPGYPCDPVPATLEVDETYPERVRAWADEYVLP